MYEELSCNSLVWFGQDLAQCIAFVFSEHIVIYIALPWVTTA